MKLIGASVDEVVASDTDIFGRDAFANGLLRLFSSSQNPLVVALDEKWGAGKTVFAKRFAKRGEGAGHTVVYFDAFKRDYDPDVFIGLTSELLAKFPADPVQEKTIKEKAVAVGRVLGRMGLKIGVRALTGGIAKLTDFDEVQGEITTEGGIDVAAVVDAELDKLIDQRLSGAKTADAAFDGFRKSLQELGQAGGDNAKPLIFIVDELDRCRPDYALDVLETIKHFFSVPGVHFLIVCDFEQLVLSIRKRYGFSKDAELYLEKFIDARVAFPAQDKSAWESSLQKFIAGYIRGMPDDQDNGQLWSGMAKWVSRNAIIRKYSLRKIERILTQFGLCMAFTQKDQARIGAIIYVLVDLKVSNRDLFNKVKSGNIEFSEIASYYQIDNKSESWYWKWLQFVFDKNIDRNSSEWQSMATSLWQYHFDDPQELGVHLANSVVDRITS